MKNKWGLLTFTSAIVLAPFFTPVGSVAYANTTTPSVSAHQTSSKIPFTNELLSKVPSDVRNWVNENSSEPGTFFLNHNQKTYILVSRGWQAGTRSVKIVAVNRVHSGIQVTYQNVDPKPGAIDSHVMAKRFQLISIAGSTSSVHFVRKLH